MRRREVPDWRYELAWWYARKQGMRMDGGNWIRSATNGRPVAHGYRDLYRKFKAQIWRAFWSCEHGERVGAFCMGCGAERMG